MQEEKWGAFPDIPEPICDNMLDIHDGCEHDGVDVSYHEAMGYDFDDDSTDMSERGING